MNVIIHNHIIRYAGGAAFAAAVVFTLMTTPKARAKSDPEAVEICKKMIEAHGGLEKWRSAPTVSFEDRMTPAGASFAPASRVVVEQTSRRAYIDYPEFDMSIAWDGEKAWGVDWGIPAPPRFMALLNYYFVNLPWLTMDPGVILSDVKREKLWDDPTEYITVRMTFEPGVGDTPDDYYVLYIHPERYELKGCRYIVTYKALLPEGEKATPEHILLFDAYQVLDGLMVPTHYTIYEKDQTVYATCPIRNWSFTASFDESRMTMPANAVIDTTTP